MIKSFLIASHLLLATASSSGQKLLAITIDDVPNTTKYEKDKFQPKLLNTLDSLQIPIAIFINEGLLYKTDSVTKNFSLLNKWISSPNTTLGNHSFSHPHYSELGLEQFSADIIKGESITNELARIYKKSLRHFRFPFNDLEKDSLQHTQIKAFLTKKNYAITPFTIESADWMFNYLYEYYLKKGNNKEAQRIAETYIQKTLDIFDFFDSLAIKQYQRDVKQIYLCHDNRLNADYIHLLVNKLQEKGYSFISLDNALKDKMYKQKNLYYKKWGISWVYRWMQNSIERSILMRSEPDINNSFKEYKKISALN